MGGLAFYLVDVGKAAASPTPRTSAGCSSRYVYLKGLRPRLSPWAEVKYRYVKWKIGRARKKFDVYSGGRSDGRGEATAGIAASTDHRLDRSTDPYPLQIVVGVIEPVLADGAEDVELERVFERFGLMLDARGNVQHFPFAQRDLLPPTRNFSAPCRT